MRFFHFRCTKQGDKMREGFKKFLHIFFYPNFWRAVFVVLVVCFAIFSPAVIFREEKYKLNLNEFLNLESGNKIVLDLCHVETFEGGSASRAGFLKRQAEKFNKQNNNFFVSVTTMSLEEFELNINSGYSADLYSFGTGAGSYIQNKLQTLKKQSNIREDLQKNATLSNKIYAYPYMLSGYAVVSYESLTVQDETLTAKLTSAKHGKKIIGGTIFGTGVTNPAQALCCNNIKLKTQDVTTKDTSYSAYSNFLKKTTKSLVGTARDVARIKNREQNGNISPCKYEFLSHYSDLVQYIGVSNNLDKAKSEVATNFASFLLSDSAQKDIANYGLFSVTNLKIYEDGYMSEFEKALSLPLQSVNAFISKEEIQSNQSLATKTLCGK